MNAALLITLCLLAWSEWQRRGLALKVNGLECRLQQKCSEVVNLERENDKLFVLPLPGEERIEGEKWLN